MVATKKEKKGTEGSGRGGRKRPEKKEGTREGRKKKREKEQKKTGGKKGRYKQVSLLARGNPAEKEGR